MSQVHRRTNYLIKPGFQSRLTAIFILIVIIGANIVGAFVYLFSIYTLQTKFNMSTLPEGELGQALLPGVIISELISIGLIALLCVIITHAIAGPVYRMERVAKSIGDGDLTNFIKLRPKDELKDLADTMNEMTMGLRSKVISLKEDAAKLHENISTAKSTGELSNIDSMVTSIESIESSLSSFILERESKTFEEEKAEAENNAKTKNNDENNEKAEEPKETEELKKESSSSETETN